MSHSVNRSAIKKKNQLSILLMHIFWDGGNWSTLGFNQEPVLKINSKRLKVYSASNIFLMLTYKYSAFVSHCFNKVVSSYLMSGLLHGWQNGKADQLINNLASELSQTRVAILSRSKPFLYHLKNVMSYCLTSVVLFQIWPEDSGVCPANGKRNIRAGRHRFLSI